MSDHIKTLFDQIVVRVATQTAKPCGDGRAPVDPEEGPHPYTVVYPLPDDDVWDDPSQSALNVVAAFQVTSVAKHRGGAQWMQGRVRPALLGWRPDVPGAGVVVADGSGPLLPDETFSPPLFTVADRFLIWAAG